MTRTIEISFPVDVEITDEEAQQLVKMASAICDRWKATHPGRTMWPFGIGCKPTYIPMTREEEEAGRGIEFDESTFAIECYERADYEWKCSKCGLAQGDHREHIIDPPAGECEFNARSG